MPYFWDLVAVIVLVISIYVGVKRGFVRTVITFICYGVALFVGREFAPKLSEMLYNNYFSQQITTSINGYLTEAVKSGAVTGTDIMEKLPNWLSGMIEQVYPEFNSININVLEGAISPEFIAKTANDMATAVSGVVIELMGWFIFIILFLLIVLLLKSVAGLFTGINRLPIIGTANMILGGISGTLTGIIIIIIISLLAILIGVFMGGNNELLSTDTIRSSYIMGTLQKLFLPK